MFKPQHVQDRIIFAMAPLIQSTGLLMLHFCLYFNRFWMPLCQA